MSAAHDPHDRAADDPRVVALSNQLRAAQRAAESLARQLAVLDRRVCALHIDHLLPPDEDDLAARALVLLPTLETLGTIDGTTYSERLAELQEADELDADELDAATDDGPWDEGDPHEAALARREVPREAVLSLLGARASLPREELLRSWRTACDEEPEADDDARGNRLH